MLLSQARRLVLSLALFLLWPAAAFAQTPGALPPKAAPAQVQIKVEFAFVSAADLDKSGVAFDRVPFARSGAFLQYAVGESAMRLFQTLLRTRGSIAQAPLITATDGVTATLHTQVSDWQTDLPMLHIGLVITPRINNDDSISLHLRLQTADDSAGTPATESPVITLRTVRSGDLLVVVGLPFGDDKPLNGQKLLTFIQPTLIGTDAQTGNLGRSVLPLLPLQDTSPAIGKTVSIDVFNADLHAIVALLERQTGLKASVLDTSQAYKPVDVHLSNASLSEALGAIARSAGAQIIRDETGVYVFSPLPGAVGMPTLIPAIPAHGRSSVTAPP